MHSTYHNGDIGPFNLHEIVTEGQRSGFYTCVISFTQGKKAVICQCSILCRHFEEHAVGGRDGDVCI